MLISLLIAVPLCVSLLAFLLPRRIHVVRTISLVGSVLFFFATLALALVYVYVPQFAHVPSTVLHVDGLTVLMLVVVGWVFLSSMIVSDGYLLADSAHAQQELSQQTAYYGYAHLFACAMAVALLADHMILMWVALEASTLASTMLVAYNGKRRSLEAAWKYIILCSMGLLLGLLGILTFYVSVSAPGTSVELLFSHFTNANALPLFDPLYMKIAFVFLLIGIGTKIGLVPMHNWLPDAHGETPAPISALLSGILLSVALIVLVRFKAIVDLFLGGAHLTNIFFIVFATLSVVYAALLMQNQKNYKRLLAYSSIEHMGLATFGFALGPVGAIASLLHIMGHGLVKPLLFFASGEILHAHHTTTIVEVRGLMTRTPRTALFFFVGLLALLAMPPSVFFLSELLLLAQGVHYALGATIVIGIGVAIASFGLLHSFFEMARPDTREDSTDVTEENLSASHVVMAAQLLLLVLLSLFALSSGGQHALVTIVHNIIL